MGASAHRQEPQGRSNHHPQALFPTMKDNAIRHWLVPAILLGGFLCLLSGCVQANGELATQLANLRKQKACLTKAQAETLKAIEAKKATSEGRSARTVANLERAALLHARSRDFWLAHQPVFTAKDYSEKIFIPAGRDGGRFYLGTPALVSANNTTYTSSTMTFMTLEKEPTVATKEWPMEGFAEMKTLNLPQEGSCLVMDHALPPMDRTCDLDGFELLLAQKQLGNGTPSEESVTLVVMSRDANGGMTVERKLTIEPNGAHQDLVEWIPVDNRYLLRVFFGDEIGALPIYKGEYWGLRLPSAAMIPCDYLGLPDGMENPVAGGDIWVAGDKEAGPLQFQRPAPQALPVQAYPPAAHLGVETTKRLQVWEDGIRQTLRPAITMAVFGTVVDEE